MPFNVDQHREYQKKRYAERLSLAKERLGGKCAQCDVTEDLEFDHINAAEKSRKISEATNWSLERFLKEVDKCQLLCREHHIEKGVLAGDLSGDCKLTEDDVREIRSSGLTVSELALYYRVTRGTIFRIRSHRAWKHVS